MDGKIMENGVAIAVENLGKRYRIGVKEQMHDSLVSSLLAYIQKPAKNYINNRRLYKFENDDTKALNNGRMKDGILWALRNISFKVKTGETLGIIGRNGAGKSTLLKILSRITDPTEGRVTIRGKISSLLEVGTGFHPELTGRENIFLNGSILGMRKMEIEKKFDEIVEFSGIDRFLDTPVKRYSSGMTVRLAFSVAAHLEPDVLIVDEVLAVGDAEFQKKCLNKMKKVNEGGRTVLFVSHNLTAITRLCSRAIMIENGKLLADGPSTHIINKYINHESESFGLKEWQDASLAPTGTHARLLSVRICSQSKEPLVDVDIRVTFGIEITWEVIEEGLTLEHHLSLCNSENQVLFISLDLDDAWRGKKRQKGKYVSTAWIPGNFLAEGMIYVHLSLLARENASRQYSVESIIAFRVVDSFEGDSARGDYGGDYYGLVRPLLKWTTQLEPILS
jgi:lipopolysaccharide transport system ATP-binding protein